MVKEASFCDCMLRFSGLGLIILCVRTQSFAKTPAEKRVASKRSLVIGRCARRSEPVIFICYHKVILLSV